jgi:hypothetical protein
MQYLSKQNFHVRQRTTFSGMQMWHSSHLNSHNTIFRKEQIQPTTESLHKQATTEVRTVKFLSTSEAESPANR